MLQHGIIDIQGQRIKDFQAIIKKVELDADRNRPSHLPKTKPAILREEMAQANANEVLFQVKDVGSYEYLCYGQLVDGRILTWMHRDGIQQERDEAKNQRTLEMLLKIKCLTDIVNAQLLADDEEASYETQEA